MIALAVLAAQIALLAYFAYFAAYSYTYSVASLFDVSRKRHRDDRTPTGLRRVRPERVCGKVAVVIASFNEQTVILDTIRACEKLTYQDRTIVVGDDSNDGQTFELLREYVFKRGGRITESTPDLVVYEAPGLVLFHRFNNVGYKAGNISRIEKWLVRHRYDFMYLLDADWRPDPDALERCLEVILADDQVAFVQTKRTYSTPTNNFLQRCLALNEESCYYVDLPGRQAMNDHILFTGCCALWRVSSLVEVGGFQPGHLTEDIDLTNRTYLAGHKGVYRSDVSNLGEVPRTYRAYRRQQERWVMGSARVLKEYTWQILGDRKLPLRHKSGMLRQNAFFTPSITIELSILVGVLALWLASAHSDVYVAAEYRYYLAKIAPAMSVVFMLCLASTAVPLGMTIVKKRAWRDLELLPYAVWVSWSILHTAFVANVKGLLGFKATWFKTPKTNGKKVSVQVAGSRGIRLANVVTLIALAGIYVAEYQALGVLDVFALFWIPSLVVAAKLS